MASSIVLALDQCTKWLARTRRRAGTWSLMSIARIRPVATVRPAFTHRQGRRGLVACWLIAMVSAIGLVNTGTGLQTDVSRIGAGLALGGAAGNLLDILRRRSVTDLIDLGWWPVFNIADVGIVAGLALTFWAWK